MCTKFNNVLSCAEILPHILYFVYTIVYNLYSNRVSNYAIFLGRGRGGKFTQLEIISEKEHGILANFQNH